MDKQSAGRTIILHVVTASGLLFLANPHNGLAEEKMTAGQHVAAAKGVAAPTRYEELRLESWSLFDQGMYSEALRKSHDAYAAACNEYKEGSWQRAMAQLELDGFKRIAGLSGTEKVRFETACVDFRRQWLLLRSERAGEAVNVGTAVVNAFSDLLGEDSYLANHALEKLIIACERTDKWETAGELLERRLKSLERTRAVGDPTLIRCRVQVVQCDMAFADTIGRAKLLLDRCLEDNRTSPDSLTTAVLQHVLSEYYFDIDECDKALGCCEASRRAIAEMQGGPDWKTFGADLQHVQILAFLGRTGSAIEELGELESRVDASTLTDAERAQWGLVQAKVNLRAGKADEARLSLKKAQELSKRNGASVRCYQYSLILEGEMLFQDGRVAEAESKVGEGVKAMVERAKGDHPRALGGLTLLAEVKRRLGKQDEAVQFDKRIAALKEKIAKLPR